MTRETKVGLVVATSFLGLVGVVVAARMSTPEPTMKRNRLAQAQAPEKKDKPPEKPSEPAKDDKKDGKDNGNVITINHDEGQNKSNTEPKAFPTINLNNISEPPALPTVTQPKETVGPPPAIEDPVANEVKKQLELKKKNDALIAKVTPENGPAGQGFGNNTDRIVNDPPKGPPGPGIDPPPGLEKKTEVRTDSTPTRKPGDPPVGPGPGDSPTTPEPSAKPGPGPLANNNAPPAAGPGPEGNKPPVSTGTPVPASPPSGPGNLAAIGAPPPVASPPISVALAAGPTNNSLSNLLKYDVTAHIVKRTERSFADISQNVYGSDKYGRALVLFNREQPKPPEGVSQEPPVVQAGAQIFYPPKEILEKKYAPAIASPGVSANTGPNNASPVTVGLPTPLATTTPGNPNSVTGPPPGTNVWSEPGGGKSYRVGNNPEPMREIARMVLGDPERWPEIYRLNRTVDPAFPVPAGTVLKLP
jgi:hypothetical protein